MEIRKATLDDLSQIMTIIQDAKNLLKNNGSLQWNTPDGYPGEDVFIKDINNKHLYLLLDDYTIIGVMACIVGIDPNYNQIDGCWLTNGPYMAIHRIAIKKEYYKTKTSHILIDYAIKLARDLNLKSIRVDTHENNIPMQKLLLHFNFIPCGKITLLRRDIDALRLAYELII